MIYYFILTILTVKHVFLDIEHTEIKGRVIIELYDDLPLTCNNFISLITNKDGLSYKNSIFHRVIKNFMIQGGDITNKDGTGGISIYGSRFADEKFIYKHNKPGVLSMANAGPNTNGSQFFSTTVPTPWLDGKHVVFGKVKKNLNLIIKISELTVNKRNYKPIEDVKIVDCGLIEINEVKKEEEKNEEVKKEEAYL